MSMVGSCLTCSGNCSMASRKEVRRKPSSQSRRTSESTESTLPGLSRRGLEAIPPRAGAPEIRRRLALRSHLDIATARSPSNRFPHELRSRDDYGASADRGQTDRQPDPGAGLAPPDDADPPLRGAGGDALPEGEQDRRVLPPVQRPGAGGRGLDRRPPGGRLRHHGLSRPRPCPGPGHDRQGGDGRAARQGDRLLQGQGRLDALLRRREGLPRRPRHRRQPHPAGRRRRLRRQVPRRGPGLHLLLRRRRHQPGVASTRPSTWRPSGSCR